MIGKLLNLSGRCRVLISALRQLHSLPPLRLQPLLSHQPARQSHVLISALRQLHGLPPLRLQPLLSHQPARQSHFIPRDQYMSKPSVKLHPRHALVNNWEIIPLFGTTLTSIGLVAFAILWSIKKKVDVVYKSHSRDNISRTMDLRCPTIQKLILINQVYEPWPLMQDVLDKVNKKEAIVKQLACACTKTKEKAKKN